METRNLEQLFDEEVENQIRNLSTFYDGSEEKSRAVDDLAKLYRLKIEEEKIEEEESKNERDSSEKYEQLVEQRKDRYIKLGVEIAGIILPLMFYGIWMNKGFKFEETGAYTSTTFRNLFNRFRPTK